MVFYIVYANKWNDIFFMTTGVFDNPMHVW